ncbi:MAG TPA: hypothetical protein VGF55_12235 [Gemmataceae bacterium]
MDDLITRDPDLAIRIRGNRSGLTAAERLVPARWLVLELDP